MVWITGDKHSDFRLVENFCFKRPELSREDDALILLGDVGVNYYRDIRDVALKQHLAQLPLTLLCIHGNHEERPAKIAGYQTIQRYGGSLYWDPRYPNQFFLQDGYLYTIAGQRVLVIGGAYSTDKFLRLEHRWPWFDDEQPSPDVRARTEATLEAVNWQVDVVLTHTCPRSVIPKKLKSVAMIDFSTEDWLETIAQRLTFKRWYSGHHHVDKVSNKFYFLYDKICPFMDE